MALWFCSASDRIAARNPPACSLSRRNLSAVLIFSRASNLPLASSPPPVRIPRFLGLTEEEIAENERLWREENGKAETQASESGAELRGAGISQAGISSDLGIASDAAIPPPPGGEAAPEGAAASPVGGAAPAAPAAPV